MYVIVVESTQLYTIFQSEYYYIIKGYSQFAVSPHYANQTNKHTNLCITAS